MTQTSLQVLVKSVASTFGMGDGSDLVPVLKATCFKGSTQVSDAQMTALLVVASQYKLNPFTREIFAFPDKGGIVPVVSVDGWARIVNEQPQMDGMEFIQDAESCTAIIYRKDRSHPTKVTEYMIECKRGTQPWNSHPRRMLRHKALIQCARMAFGFAGIFDEDEAGRIKEATAIPPVKSVDPATGEITEVTWDITAALDMVESASDLESLAAVWGSQGELATKVKDRGGYAALRDAVKNKRDALEAALPVDAGVTDVEPRMAEEGEPA